MKLATAIDVLATMGIVSNVGSLANASQSLELSFSITENLLETTLTQQHVTDYFDTIGEELCYRTTNMLLDKDSIVVRFSTNGDPLVCPTDGDLLPATEYTVNADKGTITLRQALRKGVSFLSVAYDSGLAATDKDEDVLEAPQWLRDTAIACAVHVQNTIVSSPANRKDKSIAAVSNEIRNIASQLLNSRKRPRMTVVFPSASVVDD